MVVRLSCGHFVLLLSSQLLNAGITKIAIALRGSIYRP